MPASLSELALGWETWFRLEELLDHSDQYVRTFRAWNRSLRADRERARALVGEEFLSRFSKYFATGELMYRLREDALYRVILSRRPEPKRWAFDLSPSALVGSADVVTGASRGAVESHYDIDNEFYALWLGPTMLYTSGWWEPGDNPDDRSGPAHRKMDRFAELVLPGPGARVLDVGCGWGSVLNRLVEHHDVAVATGLTLSTAQCEWARTNAVEGVEVLLEGWEEHKPADSYDAIVSFGAFEHFARDGSDRAKRVRRYQSFFESCYGWLRTGGRLGLETIVYEDAPDTASPLGRGPLGDAVLSVYPESTCPHLAEVLLGFEPWFELRVLRTDATDFALTCRQWSRALRARWPNAVAAVGEETAAKFRQYLAASEIQFRLRAITNARLVLQRRDHVRY
jgi:cyclopropane-fatty-acyl-phospholipid synthase